MYLALEFHFLLVLCSGQWLIAAKVVVRAYTVWSVPFRQAGLSSVCRLAQQSWSIACFTLLSVLYQDEREDHD